MFTTASGSLADTAAPTNVKIVAAAKKLTVTWDARAGATWQIVFENQAGMTVLLPSTKKNSFIINTPEEGFAPNRYGIAKVYVAQCLVPGKSGAALPEGALISMVSVECAEGQLGAWTSAQVKTIPSVDIQPSLDGRKLTWELYGWFGDVQFSKVVVTWGKTGRAIAGARTLDGAARKMTLPRLTSGEWSIWIKAYVDGKLAGKQLIESWVR